MSLYTASHFEAPNKLLNFLFKLRAWIIIVGFLLIAVVVSFLRLKYHQSLSNCVAITLMGVGLITLFYHILNVHQSSEANYRKIAQDEEKFNYDKTKHLADIENNKIVLAFNISSEFFKSLSLHAMNSRKFLDANQTLIDSGNAGAFNEALINDDAGRQAIASMLNYFENVSIAVTKGLCDESFIKEAFYSLFKRYYEDLQSYINYKRKLAGNDHHIYEHFVNLAKSWTK